MEIEPSCLVGAGCAGVGSMGMLVLSLGITIALVGALFYYVRQRFEVLEVSHKEQIGVMQNFIASIGDQFHRMHSFIQEQGRSIMFAGGRPVNGGGDGEFAAAAVPATTAPAPLAQFSGGSLIDVSSSDDDEDDSDYSDYDDDSASSNTDDADFRGDSIKIHEDADADADADDDIYYHNDVANKERTECNRASDIKIIELFTPHNRAATSDGTDTDDEDTDTGTDTDTDTDTDADADADADADKAMNVTVIKTESTYYESSVEPLQQDDSTVAAGANRSMVIDLDLGELVDIETISSLPIPDSETADDATDISASVSYENDKIKGGAYTQMSIKQLRKLVKFHNVDIHNQDISKLKRDQLSEILAAANVKT